MASLFNKLSNNDNVDDDVLKEYTSYDDDEDDVQEKARQFDLQSQAAERLSMRLLATKSEEEELEVLRESFSLVGWHDEKKKVTQSSRQPCGMWVLFALAFLALIGLTILAFTVSGPPNQPVGPYQLIERQEGMDLFNYYTFLEGRDSVGSNGFNTYVGKDKAEELGILYVAKEEDTAPWRKISNDNTGAATGPDSSNTNLPFVYMSSAPMPDGRRYSIRLEGKHRFNRGLFLLDVRHMPTGCGAWPAFWLTDEDNWPVHGEIDILEGVNYQTEAKTALHTTKTCHHRNVPPSYKTGTWDTAVGIPDRDTGIPDMTIREANDCFVYNPHQWLNQGCVAVSDNNETLGKPMNDKGGGIYALEWDPVFSKIRTWVFDINHVPLNLQAALNHEEAPNPDSWPLPYGYFAVGEHTNCPASHFQNMRLVINLAFCGSVAGNRFQMDCPELAEQYDSCNDYIQSVLEDGDESKLSEMYWKIQSVHVYERQWERAWHN